MEQDRQKANEEFGEMLDFVEDLLETPGNYSPTPMSEAEPGMVDISEIEVPDNFASVLLEGKCPPLEKPTAPSPVKETQKGEELTLDKDLLLTLLNKVLKMEETIKEMTTVGALGVNLAPTKPKTKKKSKRDELLDKVKKLRGN